MELVAAGLKDRAIADRLLKGTKTVEAHVASIFRKLGLTSNTEDSPRVHAVLFYLREGSGGSLRLSLLALNRVPLRWSSG